MCSFKTFNLCTASGIRTEDTQTVCGLNELVVK